MRGKKKLVDGETSYVQMGMAALLPGMAHMVELMQRQLDEFRGQLAMMQKAHVEVPVESTVLELDEEVKVDKRSQPWNEERKAKYMKSLARRMRDPKKLAQMRKAAAHARAARIAQLAKKKDSKEEVRQRKLEYDRKYRAQKRAGTRPAAQGRGYQPNHPKYPGHPGHAEWVEKMRRVTKESALKRMAAKRQAAA